MNIPQLVAEYRDADKTRDAAMRDARQRKTSVIAALNSYGLNGPAIANLLGITKQAVYQALKDHT